MKHCRNSSSFFSSKNCRNFIKKTFLTAAILLSANQVFAATPTYYRVKAGDTLQSIANQYNTTINTLININNLNDKNDIKVGDRIYLSDTSAISYHGKTMSYIVQNGDTVSSIARRFNTKPSVIAELNDMGDNFNNLYVGNTIVVPMPATVATTTVVATKATDNKPTIIKATAAPAAKSQAVTFDYQVKSGETLFGIANKYKIDKTELMNLNGLDYTSKVSVGQTLKIPGTADRINAIAVDKAKTASTTAATVAVAKKPVVTAVNATAKTSVHPVDFTNYKVKTGESLSILATKYNTTVAGLAKINNLPTTAQLKVGQTIVVPVHDVQ